MNSLLMDAIRCQNRSQPPVWIMRQAGRYLPEYRQIRERYSFLDMCRQPDLAAKIALLPLHRYEMDAVILFADILLVVDALGAKLTYEEGKRPYFKCPIRSSIDIDQITIPVIEEELGYVRKEIEILKSELKVPLIGFCGAPWTLASYFIEPQIKQWIYRDEESLHCLLELLTEVTIEYVTMQVDAGIDVLQVFDTWISTLSPLHFKQFSFPYLERIVKHVQELNVPVILFSRGTHALNLASLKPDALSVDWSCSIPELRKTLGPSIALQGNFDPALLYGSKSVIQKEVKIFLNQMQNDSGYICNLGHGIYPDVSPDALSVFIESVKNI